MITAMETHELVTFLQSAAIPIVLVNRYIRTLDIDVVRIDNYRGGYMAAQYLLEKGHRHIAHLAGPRNSAAPQDRLRGFADEGQQRPLYCRRYLLWRSLARIRQGLCPMAGRARLYRRLYRQQLYGRRRGASIAEDGPQRAEGYQHHLL